MPLSTESSSEAQYYVLRLFPGEDLLLELRKFVSEKNIKAAFIASCVGSVSSCILRPAGEPCGIELSGKKFEIVSLVGTLESENNIDIEGNLTDKQDNCHLHMSVSNENCEVIGGHVLQGCIVRTTAEIVIGSLKNFIFIRKYDGRSGYNELFIESNE